MRTTRWLIVILLVAMGGLLLIQQKPRHSIHNPNPEEITEAKEDSAEPEPSSGLPPVKALQATAASALAEAPSGNHLQVTVRDEAGRAIESAVIATDMRTNRSRAYPEFPRNFTTSAHGIANVLWPAEKIDVFEMTVSKDGYSSRKMTWDMKTGDEIPASHTFVLGAAVEIGGVVVDPAGNPIENATVSLSRFWRGGEERLLKGEEATFGTQKHTTGADGRWTARNVPPQLLDRIFVTASHDNFLPLQVNVENKPEIEEQLRAGTYRMELGQGYAVRGRVIDEQQQPVAWATVWAGRKYSRDRKTSKTDAQGSFQFQNISTGRVDFSVMADGYAPATKAHEVSTGIPTEIVFQLEKGSIIRGIVTDEASQPIEGVRVVLAGSPPADTYDKYEFTATTGADGRFEWKSAPNTPVPFYIGKSGYEQKRGVQLKPAEESVIVLRRSRKIQGVVLDGEKGTPVTEFSVTVGIFQGDNRVFSQTYGRKDFKNEQGEFTYDLSEESQSGIEVSANGYSDQAQRLPAAEDGIVKITLNLKPATTLTGIVVNASGQPVPGVSVALVDGAAGGRSVRYVRGQIQTSNTRTKILITDTAGRFEVTSPPEAGNIVASGAEGYGSASVAEVKSSGVIVLQQHGRIEGVSLQGNGPAVGQELLLSASGTGVSFDFTSFMRTTDADGRFVFDHVPAGTWSVVRLVRVSQTTRAHSHSVQAVVKPGETTQLVIGGGDATLHGRVRFEGNPPDGDYTLTARLSTTMPPIPPDLPVSERAAFLAQRNEMARNAKYYAAVVAPDGTVTLDSVAPGHYTLRVSAENRQSGALAGRPLASGEAYITVPEGANPSAPINVGEVILRSTPTAVPGR